MTDPKSSQDEQRAKARRTAAVLGAVALLVYLAFLISGMV